MINLLPFLGFKRHFGMIVQRKAVGFVVTYLPKSLVRYVMT